MSAARSWEIARPEGGKKVTAQTIETDVAIVGAGPVGTLLAILLGQRGKSVTLVERWITHYELPRAVTYDHEIARILEEVGLADLARQPARMLSGGEQQRLTLARALATTPRVLFLDEPTASLDPASTTAIEAIVQRAHERGTKIVFVTHDLGQARRLADDVLFLNKGRVAEHSPAHTFFDQPRSRAAIAYLDDHLI